MAEKWATPQGTAKYFQWASIDPSKKRMLDGLQISALGAGSSLGAADDATDRLYEKALVQAGLSGVNFFDTAIQYRSMRSEKLMKNVLRELAGRGVGRDQLVIATKGGFLASDGPEDQFEDYIRTHYLDTGVIERHEIVADSHCMTPAFLENQIAASLKNMGLEAIDLYFLQNPEIELAEAGEEEFYKRLAKAFALFEKKVKEKKILRYGIASWNGFRVKKGSLQLAKVIDCAKEAGGGGHHFKAIQVPYNLVMLEAIKMKNQQIGKEKLAILDAAAKLGVAFLASAPFMQGQVGHICPRVYEKLPPEETTSIQALQYVLSTPHLASAFAGMKEMNHFEENRKALLRPDWNPKEWASASLALGLKEE